MSLVLRKSILYSYAHNKGTDQTARVRILIRMQVVRCSDSLLKGFFFMANSNLRRPTETNQAVVVLPRHNNNTFIL